MKRRGVNHFFSTDPLNPKGLYKPRFQGNVQKRALSVQENPSGKGVVLLYKNKRNQTKPAKAVSRVTLNRGAAKTLQSIRNFSNKQNYRKDLKNVVLRRASALLRGQRIKNSKKTRQSKKKE